MMHVYDYLDSPEADPIAKEYLDHACRPAIEKNHKWLEDNAPSVEWKGGTYFCVGASRFGDVWLRDTREQDGGAFYNHRVDIAELSNWQRPTRATNAETN